MRLLHSKRRHGHCLACGPMPRRQGLFGSRCHHGGGDPLILLSFPWLRQLLLYEPGFEFESGFKHKPGFGAALVPHAGGQCQPPLQRGRDRGDRMIPLVEQIAVGREGRRVCVCEGKVL